MYLEIKVLLTFFCHLGFQSGEISQPILPYNIFSLLKTCKQTHQGMEPQEINTLKKWEIFFLLVNCISFLFLGW